MAAVGKPDGAPCENPPLPTLDVCTSHAGGAAKEAVACGEPLGVDGVDDDTATATDVLGIRSAD